MILVTVEAALNIELDELGYRKNEPSETENSRNGFSSKILRTEEGQFEVDIPRDRQGEFEPQRVKKHPTRITSMNETVLYLYSKGLSTRDIVDSFKELYGADVSASLISKVTDTVIEQVIEWQSRPLDKVFLKPYKLFTLRLKYSAVSFIGCETQLNGFPEKIIKP